MTAAAGGVDPQAFRVTYLCACAADYAEGYGATVEEAEANVRRFWKRDGHRLRDISSRIVEHAVEHAGGGSHYEELGDGSDPDDGDDVAEARRGGGGS